MKKKLFFFSTIILTLAGCTSEDYVGNDEHKWENENGKAISLNLVAAPQTRSVGGSEAAGLLNNNFVIYGMKSFTSGTPATQVVFNNYQANYVTGSNNTTTSNSVGWEYVGYKNLPYGTTISSGGTLNNHGVATNATASGVDQSIKYWDYSADKYEFFGYSLGGTSTTTSWAKSTAMSSSPYTYKLSGNQAQLSACYVSDLVTKENLSALTTTAVQLPFRQMESKIKIAFYEIIPGYSVKDLKFYKSASVTSGASVGWGDVAFLYATESSGKLPTGGEYTITFDTNGRPQLAFDGTVSDGSSVTELSFDDAVPTTGTTWTDWVAAEYLEKVGGSDLGAVYLGRSSSASTKSPSVSVLPNPDGTDLGLKMDFTLVALDGNGETINVKGATATVPSEFTQWQPNCSYTYVFKISDNTNGAIGTITGLHPITLDAVVNTNADGKQETITTVSAPSITTYQKGSNVTGMDEYYAGNIYVVVGDGTTTLTSSNTKLYTATIEDGAAQGITESAVANALENGVKDNNDNPTSWTVTDANDKDLVVTAVATDAADKLTAINVIPAADAPGGKDITIKGASFAATAGTSTKYYVFEYTYQDTNSETKKLYKVIKVGPITAYQKDVTSTEEYQDGNIYFWVGDGSTALTVNTDAKLYTVTNVKEGTVDNPVHEINEVSVANVLANGTESGDSKAITDANNWTMTVTSASGLAAFTSIPAADSSSGTDESKKGVKFTATAGTNYVLEYINSGKKYYKVIKVASGS